MEQTLVCNSLMCVQMHDGFHLFRGSRHVPAIQHIKHTDSCNHDEEDCRTVIHNKVKHRKPCLHTNHDIRRIANQSERTTNIGCHDLYNKVRYRAHLEHLAYRKGNRTNQQYRSYVIQERREYCSNKAEQHHDDPWVTFCCFCRFNRDVLEYTRLFNDRHKDHHTDQNTECAEVDVLHANVERDNASQNKHNGTRKRGSSTMDLFRDDKCEYYDEDHNGNDLRCS